LILLELGCCFWNQCNSNERIPNKSNPRSVTPMNRTGTNEKKTLQWFSEDSGVRCRDRASDWSKFIHRYFKSATICRFIDMLILLTQMNNNWKNTLDIFRAEQRLLRKVRNAAN
jgi:hypothetical protein